jgi:transcriptional regulator with XRE-family HTH domain
MLTATQCRMARAALKWGVRDVAKATGLSANTIVRIENGANATASTLKLIQEAFEKEGVQFTKRGVEPPKESGD